MEYNKEFSTVELQEWIKDLETELRRARRVTQMQLERTYVLQAYVDLLMAERAQIQDANDKRTDDSDNSDA